MPRLLITGASGFLGWNLFQHLRNEYEATGTFARHPFEAEGGRAIPLDVRERASVDAAVRHIRPKIIIHTAALISPAECHSRPALARAINAAGTEHVARAARAGGCRLIYTSTDRVFDGRKGMYTEEDRPAPLGEYEAGKLEGEEKVREIIPDALIVRLPLMYGPKSSFHGSFIEWMLEGFRQRRTLELFSDQYRTPLYVEDACRAVARLLHRSDLSGIFHLGGGERINRADFGYRMAGVFGFDPSVIKPLRMSDKPGIPPTPADVSLNSDKLFRATGFRARGVSEGLSACKTALQKQLFSREKAQKAQDETKKKRKIFSREKAQKAHTLTARKPKYFSRIFLRLLCLFAAIDFVPFVPFCG